MWRFELLAYWFTHPGAVRSTVFDVLVLSCACKPSAISHPIPITDPALHPWRSWRAIRGDRYIALARLQTSTPKPIFRLHGLLSLFHLIQVPSQAANIPIITYLATYHSPKPTSSSHFDISAAITRSLTSPHPDELELRMTFDHH